MLLCSITREALLILSLKVLMKLFLETRKSSLRITPGVLLLTLTLKVCSSSSLASELLAVCSTDWLSFEASFLITSSGFLLAYELL